MDISRYTRGKQPRLQCSCQEAARLSSCSLSLTHTPLSGRGRHFIFKTLTSRRKITRHLSEEYILRPERVSAFPFIIFAVYSVMFPPFFYFLAGRKKKREGETLDTFNVIGSVIVTWRRSIILTVGSAFPSLTLPTHRCNRKLRDAVW